MKMSNIYQTFPTGLSSRNTFHPGKQEMELIMHMVEVNTNFLLKGHLFLVLRPRSKSRLVLSDWSGPVLSDWSAPAMGAPPKAEKPGKPLFGNGEHLANVGQYH